MKRLISIGFCVCVYICLFNTNIKAYDFSEMNEDGIIFYYSIIQNGDATNNQVVFEANTSQSDSSIIYIDTLHIPESVIHNGVEYHVRYKSDVLSLVTSARPKVLILPDSYGMPGHQEGYGVLLYQPSDTVMRNGVEYSNGRLQSIIVNDTHTHLKSIDGVLYTKTLDTLLCFPSGRRGMFDVPQTVKCVHPLAFYQSAIDTIEIPDNDINFGMMFIYQALNLKSFRYPNKTTRILENCFIYGLNLEEIIFGSGLNYLGATTGVSPKLKRIVCLAVTPPVTTVQQFYGSDSLTLFVPRKSIGLYRQAQGWSTFSAIEPIEPPVVSGVNNAEISWVTNAEASSYSLTLYLDSAQTRRLLTLTFDDRGYLQNMDINPDVYSSSGAPAFDGYAAQSSMPSRVRQAHEEETPETEVNEEQFNTYLSFTVTGLRAGSEYFFVRRTYNAMNEVIDEEQGSFETLPDTETGLDNGNTTTDLTPTTASKRLQDGQVLIVSPEGSTYTPDGKGWNTGRDIKK